MRCLFGAGADRWYYCVGSPHEVAASARSVGHLIFVVCSINLILKQTTIKLTIKLPGLVVPPTLGKQATKKPPEGGLAVDS